MPGSSWPGSPVHRVSRTFTEVATPRKRQDPWEDQPPHGCRQGWLGFRGGLAPCAVPALPAGDLHGGHRAGPRHRAAAGRAGEQPGQPRLPLLRSPRLRQDDQRADPGAGAQLRAGAGGRPVRGVRLVPGHGARGSGQHRRDRDRRGVPRRRRRRPRPAREGVLRAGPQQVQGLHRRRGPHGHHAGLQRPAQARRGAAAAPPVHLRDHRARQGAADDPLAHPSLPVPADPPAAALGVPLRALREGERRHRGGRAATRRPRGCRVGARLPERARPAHRWRRPGGCHLPAGRRPARLHPRCPPGRRDRGVRCGRRGFDLRRRRPRHRDRAGPAPVRRGPPPPAPRPGHHHRRPGRPGHRPDRRRRGRRRTAGRAGRPVRGRRAQPRRGPGRHRPHRDARRHRTPAAPRARSAPGCSCRAPTTAPTG